jgi:hypothetical protein
MPDGIRSPNVPVGTLAEILGNTALGDTARSPLADVAAQLSPLLLDSLRGAPFMMVARAGTSYAERADYVAAGADDDVPIEAAATELHASGGGTLYIAPGFYDTAAGVLAQQLNGVHVLGGGRGATVLQKSQDGGIGGFVFAGCNNYSLSNITVDNAANDCDGMGIINGPANPSSGAGARGTNGRIFNVEVKLQPFAHNYGIWALNCDHVKILDWEVDGSTPVPTTMNQEAVEAWGCSNVEIGHGHAKNINGNAISIVTLSGVVTPGNTNINVHDITLENCMAAVWLNSARWSGASQPTKGVTIKNITGSKVLSGGVKIQVDNFHPAGGKAVLRNVIIQGINLDMALASEGAIASTAAPNSPYPILFVGGGAFADMDIDKVLLKDHHYGNCQDIAGLELLGLNGNVANVTLDNVNASRAANAAVGTKLAYIYASKNVKILNSTLGGCTGDAIVAQGGQNHDGLTLDRYTLRNINATNAGSRGVLIDSLSTSNGMVITNGIFDTPYPPADLVTIDGTHSRRTLHSNRCVSPGFTGRELNDFGAATASHLRRGSRTMGPGETFFTIATDQCRQDTVPTFSYSGGVDATVTRVKVGPGTFTAYLAAAASGAVINWFIL